MLSSTQKQLNLRTSGNWFSALPFSQEIVNICRNMLRLAWLIAYTWQESKFITSNSKDSWEDIILPLPIPTLPHTYTDHHHCHKFPKLTLLKPGKPSPCSGWIPGYLFVSWRLSRNLGSSASKGVYAVSVYPFHRHLCAGKCLYPSYEGVLYPLPMFVGIFSSTIVPLWQEHSDLNNYSWKTWWSIECM